MGEIGKEGGSWNAQQEWVTKKFSFPRAENAPGKEISYLDYQ